MPWRATRDPYAILVSEFMLQQTQVERVISYYESFLARFPDFASLATASNVEVLTAWQGLGYNRRALNLKKTAEAVIREFDGVLPKDIAALEKLPGVGPATAGAITVFAFNAPSVFIETNIRRVFLYHFFPRARAVNDRTILPLIAAAHPRKNPRAWYYALMDYGAALGKQAHRNPNQRSRHYTNQGRFTGSNRELRGRIIRILLEKHTLTASSLAKQLGESVTRLAPLLAALRNEKFIQKNGKYLSLT
ncbi:MAG: A/G-specific adenine glycosylase [Candidatus Sungbacteria bacterium]|nr:A/G-specific adenine glycosylase [Candidatus Sungbacteria bacterium]